MEHLGPLGSDEYSYGIQYDLKKKIKEKWDPAKAEEAKKWLEALINRKLPGTLHEELKDGIVLSQAINAIKPGSVKKINMEKQPFKQRENIINYLAACKALGMNTTDLFVSQDLYEGDNLITVVNNIFSLGGLAQRVEGFKGPYLGVARMILEDKAIDISSRIDNIIRNPDEFAKNRVYKKDAHVSAASSSSSSAGDLEAQASEARAEDLQGGEASSASLPPGVPRFCGSCGTERVPDARFCGGCGADLSTQEQEE